MQQQQKKSSTNKNKNNGALELKSSFVDGGAAATAAASTQNRKFTQSLEMSRREIGIFCRARPILFSIFFVLRFWYVNSGLAAAHFSHCACACHLSFNVTAHTQISRHTELMTMKSLLSLIVTKIDYYTTDTSMYVTSRTNGTKQKLFLLQICFQ